MFLIKPGVIEKFWDSEKIIRKYWFKKVKINYYNFYLSTSNIDLLHLNLLTLFIWKNKTKTLRSFWIPNIHYRHVSLQYNDILSFINSEYKKEYDWKNQKYEKEITFSYTLNNCLRFKEISIHCWSKRTTEIFSFPIDSSNYLDALG